MEEVEVEEAQLDFRVEEAEGEETKLEAKVDTKRTKLGANGAQVDDHMDLCPHLCVQVRPMTHQSPIRSPLDSKIRLHLRQDAPKHFLIKHQRFQFCTQGRRPNRIPVFILCRPDKS